MIDVQNLSVQIAKTPILHHIDLTVEKENFVGIVGPNGSGKSTLLKCIYQTIRNHTGEIKLNGSLIQNYSKRELAQKIAVVAQQNTVDFDFTVESMVLLGRSPYKKALEPDTPRDHALVKEKLKAVGLENFENRIYTTLSGGEQQRVLLARALVQDTPCILLDEPTNHMDIKHQLQFLSLVKKSNKTILAVLHDLNIASLFCDKIYLLHQGRIKTYGPPINVLTKENIKDVYAVDVECIVENQNLFIHYSI